MDIPKVSDMLIATRGEQVFQGDGRFSKQLFSELPKLLIRQDSGCVVVL